MNTFEDYLKENHAKHYRGLDDDMPDAYEKWVTDLDLTTVIELAEEAMKENTRNVKLDSWDDGYQAGFFRLPIEKAKADFISKI